VTDLPTFDHLDELVDTDPIQLREEAWALLVRVGDAEAEVERLRAEAKEHRERAERVRRILDREREARMDAQAKVRRVHMLRAWTNEDGKDFVFADDLRAALEPEEKAV
jgi:riboflavin biosynthesis pyrimidine reductase